MDHWPIMSFFYSGSEITIYRVSSGNKFDGKVSYMTAQGFNKKVLL